VAEYAHLVGIALIALAIRLAALALARGEAVTSISSLLA
jgi:hypothetical protein